MMTQKIGICAFQWKMSFNPDINKQTKEVAFTGKLQKSNHPSLTCNGARVNQFGIEKHLGMLLDSKLDVKDHMKNAFNNVVKQLDSIRKKCPYSEFFCSVFSVFGLNTERYEVSLSIQSEYGKMQTRKTTNKDTFRSNSCVIFKKFSKTSFNNNL